MTLAVPLPGVNTPPWSLCPVRSVMGIDPSTKRMSAAMLVPYAERRNALGEVAFVVDTLSLPQPGTDSRRLAESYAVLKPWLDRLLAQWAPELVVVEQPFAAAKHVPPVSYYAIGVLLAVIGAHRVPVEMVTPAQWKRAAMGAGKGGVRKPKRGSGEEYGVLAWARDAGYEGELFDEADAIGIATCGGVWLDERARA